ncbi:hypothetical protein [Flavobacterium luteum]|uniref:Glycosyl transferase n=1 Tax=Flavobacterium luteum TaxID=2026654 RepID=A0A7J5AB27_9FLAO|nr:hypothetical protein [Flavobacterium luteum]KAB1154766.1 hypothetical protein F6464_11995 [Flavobacterium luteum]
MKKIQVGFLMSYDYELLKKSIPPVYEMADTIFLALDYKKRTWSGNYFEVDDSFYRWLKEFDVKNKIVIYEDDFYVPEITGMQNDTRERYMLALKMGIGNWLIQVDSDEIFIDFEKFVKRIRKYDSYLINPSKHPIQFAGFHINVYKYLEDGLLYVNKPTKLLLATNYPNYKYAKNTKERIIYDEDFILHEGLARTEEELVLKLKNWSHKEDVNPNFLEKWKRANKDNYHEIKDVFYLNPEIWKELGYFPTKSLSELKKLVQEDANLKIPRVKLFFRNFGQWFKHLQIKKINYHPKFEKYF